MPSRSSRVLATPCFFSERSFQSFVLIAAVVAFAFPSINSTSLKSANSCIAQAQLEPQTPQPDLKKAKKYHSALLRRPTPGYLYDRFYNTWLDTSSQEDLKEFLAKRADAPNAEPADRLLLAFFYAKQGKDVEALQQFRVALENNPDNAATLYEMATIEARTLDFEAALKNLSKAAEAKPSADEAIKIAQLQGKLLVRNRQNDEAAKVWDELVKNNPDDLGLMEDLIELQISEGMYAQAEALSDKLIEKTKDPFQKVIRQLRKGDILQRGGSQSKALKVYGNTLAQVGMNSWIEREILGQVEQTFRREDDLIGLSKHLAKLMAVNKGRVSIQKARSKIFMELGQTDDAIKAFEKIIELTPGNRENREAFTNLLIRADQTKRAVKQMEALVAQHPKDAELQIRLAELCNKIPSPEKAKAAMDKFILLSGSTEYSYLRAARLFEKFKDLDSAKVAYTTALEKFKDSDSVKESWADFLFRTDSKDEAIKVWQALAKDTDRAGLVRLARLVSVRKLNQVALDMLLARYDEFKLDSIYLGQLCTEAIALKKFPEAVTWATERVRLAKTSGDLDVALPPAILIINAAKETESVIENLRNKKGRSAVETCLLVEMLERDSLGDEAEATLKTSFDASKAAKNNQDIQILARQRVRLARGRQDWVGAAKAARELLDLPGGRKSPNVRQLIELYVRANDDKSALKWIAEWKRLSPGSLLPWLNEATLLERDGKTSESISVLRRATQEFPDEPDLFGQLAQKYLRNGQTDNAERIFWRQYEDSEKLSDKIRWAEQLAKVADGQGKIDQLVKSFDERRKNNPQSIEPLISIAQAHRIAGNYEERRAALLEATRLKKDDLSLLFEIARLEESEGDWEKAILTLERASTLDKTSRAKQKIAQLYLQYGETKEGLTRLLDIAGGENSTAEDIEKISQSIMATENWDELLNFLGPHVARFPNNYRLGFLTAIANEELGNREAATRQFLDLLQVNQEMTNVKAAKKNPYQSQLAYFKGALPESAIDLMRMVSEIPASAYSYRKNSRTNYYGPPGSSGSGRYLPSDLDSCHQFALCHIRDIAQDSTEQERAGLQTQLGRLGIENANLLLADLSQQEIQTDPMALLEADPDNEAGLAIAMVTAVSSQAEVPQEICSKSYEKFKESFPAIALFAAMKLEQTKPENQTRLAAAVKRLKTIEDPNFILVSFIARGGANRNGGDEEDDPLKKYRGELNQLLLEWYPKLSVDPQMSGWAFEIVVESIKGEQSPKRLMEFLDQELARIKKQGKQSSRYYGFFGGYYGQQNQAISLPKYPPRELISFPGSIYAQLEMPSPDNADDTQSYYPGRRVISPDEAAKVSPADQAAMAVSTATDPTMKVLLEVKYFYQREQSNQEDKSEASKPAPLSDSVKAAFGDQVTDAKTAIDQLFEKSKTNVDAWYLAGALAVEEERWDDAAASFETMRNLPMTAKTRRKIDGHLVALATQGSIGDLKNKTYEKVVRSAKSAALRLRRGTLSQEQRVALVSAFETLELNDEAEKMESRIASAANAGGGSSGAARAVTSIDRITKLNKAGKTEAAARLLSQEFQGIARQGLDLNTTHDSRYELEEFKRKVGKLDLQEELLEQLNPGESTNARKLGTWAIANETFDNKSKAETIYKKLVEAHPKENAARLRYILLNPTSDKQLFAQQFAKVSARSRVDFLTTMFRGLQRDRLDAEDVLSLTESIIDYEGEGKDSIDKSSMSGLLSIIGSQMPMTAGSYRQSLPSLYNKVAKAEADSSGQSKKKAKKLDALAKRQRILHDRIALRMTDSKIPGQAAQGFTALLASTEAVEKPVDDQIVKLALKTVYPVKNSAFRGGPHFQSYSSSTNYGSSSRSENRVVIKRTPVEFLARHYGFEKTAQDQQVESIAEKLEKLRAKDDAAELRNTYALCRASDDEFVGVVEKLVNDVKGKSRRPDLDRMQKALSTVIEVWKERKLQADISPIMIDFASQKPSDLNGRSSRNGIPYQRNSELLTEYLLEFAKVKEVSDVEEFLTNLRLKMLGTEEEQDELLKLIADQKSIQKNRAKVVPLGNYYFMVQSLNSRETIWLGLKEMQRFTFPGQNHNRFDYEIFAALSEFKKDEVEQQLDWLRQSSALAGLSEFDPYFSNINESSENVWGKVLNSMRYRYPSEMKKAAAELLSKKKDPTFGEKLLLSFLKAKPANVYQMIGDEVDTFKALPPEQQIRLAKFANEVNTINTSIYGSSAVSKLPSSKESKAAKTACLALLNNSVKTAVKKLLDAKRFKNLGVTPYEFEDWSKNLLASMSLAEPEEVLAAVAKLKKVSSERDVANQLSGYDTSLQTRLLEGAISKDISFESVKLALAALTNEKFQDVSFSERLTKSVGGFFRDQFSRTKKRLRKKDKTLNSPAAAAKATERIVNQFGDEYGDQNLIVLLPEIRDVCSPMKNKEAKAVNKWLHSDEQIKHPKAKQAFRLAFDCSRDMLTQLKQLRKTKTPPKRPTENKSYIKEIVDFISDDTIQLQARSRVAIHLVNYDVLSGEGVATCCQVISEAYDAGQTFSNQEEEKIFSALMASGNAPEIKEAKIAFAKSWARSMMKRKQSFYQPNVISCLNLLHLGGDKAQLVKLVNGVSSSYAPGIASTLVELGYFAEAEKELEVIWDDDLFLNASQYTNKALYTNNLEKQLPAFLGRFKDEGNKYFAEVYFSSLKNSPVNGKVLTTPKIRMAALAERLSSIKFKSKRELQQTLVLFSNYDELAKTIEAPLTKEINDLSIDSIFTSEDPELKAKLLGAYFTTQVQLNNFEPVQTIWKKINELITKKYADNMQWEARNALGTVEETTAQSFYRLMRNQTPEQLAELLPVLRDLNNYSYENPLNPQTNTLAHMLAGRPDELATYLDEKYIYDQENGIEDSNLLSINQLSKRTNSAFSRLKPTNPEARMNYAVSIWQFAKSQKLSFGTPAYVDGSLDPKDVDRSSKQGLEQFWYTNVLTKDEILKVGPKLAEIESVNGHVWLQLARRQSKAGKDLEAAESFKKSLEGAQRGIKKAKFNRRVEYAKTLVKLKRNEEARKMIEGVETNKLFVGNKGVLTKLQKTLKEK